MGSRYSLEAYDSHHRHPANRLAHAVGIPLAAAGVLGLISPWRRPRRRRRMAAAAVGAGWALLWIGHAIEGNRPAVLRDPRAALVALAWWLRRGRARTSGLPRTRALDSTAALLTDGYAFISNRCRRLGSDAFATRLMLRPVVCMMGEEAARVFYAPGRFTRHRAMPPTTVMLLQDFGSVQLLDGEAHRARKQLFLSLLGPEASRRLSELVSAEWPHRVARWRQQGRVVLHDDVREVLCQVACAWAGVPLDREDLPQRTREFGAMIDNAGRIGPRNWAALVRRRRTERWIAGIVEDIRRGDLLLPDDAPARRIASYRDESGRQLETRDATVEILNLLRPTVAVARFVTFAAQAMHEHPDSRERLLTDDEYLHGFVQEVRRYYPFFAMIGGRVREPFDWRGHRFGAGEWVLLDLYGTNHDPRIWDDPDVFRPERFRGWQDDSFSLIPQGGGRYADTHRCPGEPATVALTMQFVRLLAETPYEVPPQDLRIDLRRIPALPASRFVIAPRGTSRTVSVDSTFRTWYRCCEHG